MFSGMSETISSAVSGGQLQKLALYASSVHVAANNHLFPDRSRSFMRSLVSETEVGLLLFDEPSASLDPSAEHGLSLRLFLTSLDRPAADLFQRLRKLRSAKTMIFSSHRFGQLTRHADLILCVISQSSAVIVTHGMHRRYMDDSSVVEHGTHDDLVKLNGGYARIWSLQAQAFL